MGAGGCGRLKGAPGGSGANPRSPHGGWSASARSPLKKRPGILRCFCFRRPSRGIRKDFWPDARGGARGLLADGARQARRAQKEGQGGAAGGDQTADGGTAAQAAPVSCGDAGAHGDKKVSALDRAAHRKAALLASVPRDHQPGGARAVSMDTGGAAGDTGGGWGRGWLCSSPRA